MMVCARGVGSSSRSGLIALRLCGTFVPVRSSKSIAVSIHVMPESVWSYGGSSGVGLSSDKCCRNCVFQYVQTCWFQRVGEFCAGVKMVISSIQQVVDWLIARHIS